jgi:hypothetical protein
MIFKVIITHDSTEGDEHTYYGIAFPNRDIGQIKRLEYDSSQDRLEATFSFDEDNVKEGEHFLAILVPVDESEIKENNCNKIECRVGTNSKKREPEVVHF